jgi:hypothetical protein
MPVKRKAHQSQFPETPFVRTMSVTRLGVSVENVVATIETPRSHQGILLPDKKKSTRLLPALFDAHTPITSHTARKKTTIERSMGASFMIDPNGRLSLWFRRCPPTTLHNHPNKK